MNSNRNNFVQGVITGVLLCLVGIGAWFYGPSLLQQTDKRQEISLDTAISKIENKEIREVLIRGEQLELTDKQDAKFFTLHNSSEATEARIYKAALDTETKLKSEPASSGKGWMVLAQFLPLVLLGMFAICTVSLAILAWKALSKK